MIEMRRAQRSFGDGLIAEEVKDLREGWMDYADRLLDDEVIVVAVYEALGRRHPRSRNRGRRGLEILNRLQKDATVPIEIIDADIEGIADVDGKLVKMARNLHCSIITNDFNLNRVAELQGVKVLNINELANAIKPVLLPGEDLHIKIMQDGKELGQGVGYLDDGTMIVVENGRQFMNMTIEVTVTRVLQTVAGRMIFAHPRQQNSNSTPTPQSSAKQRQI